MNRNNIIAVGVCAALFSASFLLSGRAGIYFNGTALLVVLSGTAGATLLSAGVERVRHAFLHAGGAYRYSPPAASDVITQLLKMAVTMRREGLRGVEQTAEYGLCPQLERGINLMLENYKEDEIREVLGSELYFEAARARRVERLFRSMASYAPSFGVAGSVIGLIGLLMGIGDTSLILRSIPVALISTLYGVVLATFLLTPTAERVRAHAEGEALLSQLVMEGVCAILKETNLHKLRTRLNALVPPEQRMEDSALVKKLHRMTLSDEVPVRAEADSGQPETA